MIVERECGAPVSDDDACAVRVMLNRIKLTMLTEPKKVVLLECFAEAAESARQTGNYALLQRSCKLYW